MFEHAFVEIQDDSRQPWTLVVSFLAQCLLLSLGVLIPLIYTETLPAGRWVTQLLAPPPLAAPRASAPKAAAVARRRHAPSRVDDSVLRQPRRIPPSVALIDDGTRARLPRSARWRRRPSWKAGREVSGDHSAGRVRVRSLCLRRRNRLSPPTRPSPIPPSRWEARFNQRN